MVWAPIGRNGLFCRLPGRGGCLGGPTTKWGGQGRPAGHTAVPSAARRVRFPLAVAQVAFFSRGVVFPASGWIDPARCAGSGPAGIGDLTPLRLEITNPPDWAFSGSEGDFFRSRRLPCGTCDVRVDTVDIYGLSWLYNELIRPFVRVQVNGVNTKCRGAGPQRNEIPFAPTAAHQGTKISKK